ncbi:hypothetical protein, partial [Streptomyces wuyuanensis]|uniref:hypothetical protein n=1 Tax=Streptomyces wuyuanensis TaxID=1196353 RepID=UPI00341BCF4B
SGTRSADTQQILPTQHSTAKLHNELHSETISKSLLPILRDLVPGVSKNRYGHCVIIGGCVDS